MISPRATSKLTPSTAAKLPKRLTSPSTMIWAPAPPAISRLRILLQQCDEQVLDRRRHLRRCASPRRRRRPAPAASCGLRRSASSTWTCTPLPTSRTPCTPGSDSGDFAHLSRLRRGDLQHRAGHARLQAGRGIAIHHRSPVQQRKPIAALGLVEVGGRDQHRHAFGAQRIEDLPELAARQRVHARGRLVEQQHARRVDQRAGQAELLFHAAGELAGKALAELRHVRCDEHGLRRALATARAAPRTGPRRSGCSPPPSDPRTGRSAAACS